MSATISNGKYFFRGVQEGMKSFGFILSVVMNSLLLFVVYAVGVGITSLGAKIFKKQFLEQAPAQGEKTYWEKVDIKKRPYKEYLRQF